MDLIQLGWSATLRQHLDALTDERLVPARVARPESNACRLLTEDGDAAARLSGRLRSAGAHPTVGDWVAAEPAPRGEPWTVHAVLPRRTVLERRAAGSGSASQVVAANVDVAFVVAAIDQPVNARRIERYVAVALGGGVEPVIVLNKSDASDDVEAAARAARAAVGRVPVLAVSAATGDGVDALRARLAPGRTVCFLGPSGVGKSTLVNRLLGADIMATGAVRGDDRKGRHTTTHRELVVAPDGSVLVDTPGMRELGLADGAGVGAAFEDVEELAALCRFRDCAHAAEPGCAVRAAVETGELDAARLDSYRRLEREAAHAERRRSEAGRRAARAESRSFGRMTRRAGEAKRARRGASEFDGW